MNALMLSTPELIAKHWPAAAALLEPVVREAARGEFDIDDLQRMVAGGQAFAGIVLQRDVASLAIVFEFRHYPRRMAVNVIALGGRDLAAAAMTFWPDFRAWAKESGAAEIEACTAPAMTRVLRNLGFVHYYDLVRLPC